MQVRRQDRQRVSGAGCSYKVLSAIPRSVPPATDPEQTAPGPVLYGRYYRGRAAISTDNMDRERRRIPRAKSVIQTENIDGTPSPSPGLVLASERTDRRQAGGHGGRGWHGKITEKIFFLFSVFLFRQIWGGYPPQTSNFGTHPLYCSLISTSKSLKG